MESQLAAAPSEGNFDLLNEETFGGEEPWDFDNGGNMPEFFLGDEEDANLAELDVTPQNLAELDVTPQKSQTSLRGDIEASLGRLVDDYDADVLTGKQIPSTRRANLDELFGPSSPPGFVDPETIVTSSIWNSPTPTSSIIENFACSVAEPRIPLFDSIRETEVTQTTDSRPMPILPGKARTLEEIEQSMLSQSPSAEARNTSPSDVRVGSLPDDPAILNQDINRMVMLQHLQRIRGASPLPPMTPSDSYSVPGLPRPLSDVSRPPHIPNDSPVRLPEASHPRMPDGGFPRIPDGTFPRMPEGHRPRMPEGGFPGMADGHIGMLRGGISPMRMPRMMNQQLNGGPGGMMQRTPPPGWHHRPPPRGPHTDPSHSHGYWNNRPPPPGIHPAGHPSAHPPPGHHPAGHPSAHPPGHPGWARHPHHREEQARRRLLDDSDPYAGLMSAREKDYIVKIQLLQLHSDSPHIDDYYYLKLMEKRKSTNGVKEKRRSRFDNFVFEDRTYTPRQFSGALGKVTASSISHPRHIIDLPKASQHEESSETQQSERRKFRHLLGSIEKGYSLLLQLEDIVLKAKPSEPAQTLDTEPEADESSLRARLGEVLLHLDLLSMLGVRKGRVLLLRALTCVNKDEVCTLVSRIIRNSGDISEKESSEQFAAALGELVSSALDVSTDQMLSLIRSLEPPHIQHALQNQLGATVVCALILRGHQLLASPGPHTSNWCSLLMAVADQLCGEASLASACGEHFTFEELLACFTCVPVAIESPSFSTRLHQLCSSS